MTTSTTSGSIGISGFAGTSSSLDLPESASGLHISAIHDDVILCIPDIGDVQVAPPYGGRAEILVPSLVGL